MGTKRIAVIGDVHACIEELEMLYKALQWQSVDAIWCVGDINDRGPDSHACYQFLIKHGIKSTLGNHDDVIVSIWERTQKGQLHGNADKARTASQLTIDDIAYIKAMPRLHVDDDLGLILVHAGLWPSIPLYAQPLNVIRVQMLHPEQFNYCRWGGPDAPLGKSGKTEEESYAEGWRNWTDVYDYEQDVIYGHTVYGQPRIQSNPGVGRTIGIDQGICFGGALTACIYQQGVDPYFVTVKAKKVYFEQTRRSWWLK